MLLALLCGSAAMFGGCGGGGGGGSANGLLCDQCGATDGPCLPSVPVSTTDEPTLCPSGPTCDIQLACLRKLDSAQRRCFPADFQFNLFECDGSRANRSTVTPTATPTPTPLETLTPTATAPTPSATGLTPTPTPSPTAAAEVCGDNIVDVGEDCDGTNLDGEDCDSQCFDGGGVLSCNPDCTFNFSLCSFPDTCG